MVDPSRDGTGTCRLDLFFQTDRGAVMGLMTCRADLLRTASEIAAPLTEEQRVALGVTLIQFAREPESFMAVRHAERLVSAHATALLTDALRAEEAGFQDMTIDTAHGPNFDRHPGAGGSAGEPRPRFSSSLRAAWARFRAVERRFSDGICGDVLAGVCVVIISIGLIVITGVLQ